MEERRMLPRVSVVMANYNYARYLRAAVDSVLNQTLADLELIIVDDGSTDGSRPIIESYLHDVRVRFRPVEHLGQVLAKNAGIEWARGPLVAFLDADDIWEPTKLEKQVALFDREPALGVVYSRRTLIDESGQETPYRQPLLYRGEVLEQIFRDNFVCFSSVVVRRLVLEHVGLFDERNDLAIDYDLWLRVATHYRFDYVDEPLVHYRSGHGNLSRRVGERLKTAMLIMRRFLGRGHHQLPAATVSQALAETCCHLGIALRPFDAAAASAWFVRSLRHDARHRPAWRGLVGTLLPGRLRRLLRRGGDWEAAYRVPENDPRNL
jgi:glycosyltransferase involved in cell wall biosynthesis